MTSRDLEEDVFELLQRIQLEQFFDKIHHKLHLTRLSHFDHVTEEDLTNINMSKPEQRRLFDSLNKLKKTSLLTRLSFKKSKKKRSKSYGSPDSSRNSTKREQVKSCLISETSVTLLEKIGDGAFGFVHKGVWATSDGSKLPVAVKSMKFSKGEAFFKEQNDFKREASAMSDLDHDNVIRLYGVILSTPMMLVIELASLGCLLERLHEEPEKFPISKLCDLVLQVASGMSYLESKRYIHRDLATRNLLLASYDKVKIGDFGLMRPLPIDEDVYVMNPLGRIPFAWCAPECLRNRQFSHASDVWAFGITVVEIFSYGTQPWVGLNASQILDLVDEPACGRPSQPDHCPGEIFSLLMGHCWAHKPRDRSKFSCIKEKLSQLMPEDVTILFELETDQYSEKLATKTGDIITIITWKSRLGKRFAKAQNKRTLDVGYVPVDQINRSLVKRKDSGSQLPKVLKMNDISPPLDNSFSHCAHRGEGETPNWGQVMSRERQIVGKQIPLNLPTKLIPLRNKDESNQSPDEKPPSDIKSSNPCSINAIETSSLSSHGSSNYSGRGSMSIPSLSDSSYYGNHDIFVSPNYEHMAGSNPIAIPGMSNQAFGRQQRGNNVASYRQHSTSNDDREQTPPSRPSSAIGSPHFDSSKGQQSLPGSTCERFPIVLDESDPRPPLPPKQGIIGNAGVRQQPVMKHGRHNVEVNHDFAGDKNPYEYIVDNIYEDVSSHRPPVIPRDPCSSSPTSLYSKDEMSSDTKSFARRSLPDGNSGNERDSPPTPPPPRKASATSNRASTAGIVVSPLSTCSQKDGRSYSMPAIDIEDHCLGRENGRKASSFSFSGEQRASFDIKPTPVLDSIVSETKTEVLSEPTYENIDGDNLPVSDGFSRCQESAAVRPALPTKRHPVQRSQSEVCKNATRSKHRHDNSRNSYEQSTKDPGPWISRNSLPNSDTSTHAKISDNLCQGLGVDGQNNNVNRDTKNLERRGMASGCEDVARFQEAFREISSDYADLDAIWGNLRRTCGKPAPEACRDKLSEPTKLKNCVSAYQINVKSSEDTLWKRHSADQHQMSRYRFSQPQNCVDGPTKESPSSLKRPSRKTDCKSQRTHAKLVTTV